MNFTPKWLNYSEQYKGKYLKQFLNTFHTLTAFAPAYRLSGRKNIKQSIETSTNLLAMLRTHCFQTGFL
jgi:hypothetical protein